MSVAHHHQKNTPLQFQKKVLLNEEEYMRMKDKQFANYNSVLRTLTFLKDDMDTIILRDDLTVDQKLKLFQAAQQRFDQVKSTQDVMTADENAQVVTAPTPAGELISAPTDVSEEVAVPKSESVRDEIGDVASKLTINKRYQSKLTDLVKHLRKRPEMFGVTERGELVLHGKVVDGSNISDLMRNLYHSNKRYNLTGNVEFMRALANAHTPVSFISNSKARSSMTLTPKKGNGFSRSHFPPGKKPRILRLY